MADKQDEANKLFEEGEDATELFEAGEDVEAEKSLLDKASDYIPSKQTMSDVLTGAQQGLTFGFSDEIAAAFSAALDKAGGIDEGQDFKSLYEKYRDIERQKIKEAEERSPGAMLTGEITGAILPAFATGGASLFGSLGKVGLKEGLKQGGKKGLLKALAGKVALGGVEGAVSGALTGAGKAEEMENIIPEAYEGAKSGALFGSGIGLVGAGAEASKLGLQKAGQFADEVIESQPFLRQTKKAFQEAEAGRRFKTNDAGVERLAKESQESVSNLTNKILEVDRGYGQRIGTLIDDATNKGIKIKVNSALEESATKLTKLLAKDSDLVGEKAFKELTQELFDLNSSNLSPTGAKRLRDKINQLADNLKDYPNLRYIADDFQRNLKNLMEAQVPGLKQASDQFRNFREAVPETILGKGKLTEFSDNWFGSLKNKEEKLAGAVQDLLESVSAPGQSRKIAQKTINELTEKLKNNPQMLKAMGFNSVDDFVKNIRSAGDKEAIAQAILGYEPRVGVMKELKTTVTGAIGTTARGAAYGGAGVLGSTVRGIKKATGAVKKAASPITQPVANLSRKIMTAPDDILRGFAIKIKETPGLAKYGDVLLNALDNKGAVAKNAALFTLLQNPDARKVMEDFDFGFDTEED